MMTAIQNKYEIRPFLDLYEGLHFCRLQKEGLDYRKLSIDTRTLKAGEMYIAIRGEVHDGHVFTEQAFTKGASAVVVEKIWYEEENIILRLAGKPVIVVENTLDFLQQLSAWHRRLFSIPMIGVTGSNGKTTTREMIATVLSAKYRVFRSEGNKNNHIGLPLMLLKMTENDEIAVLEVGTNHPGEIALLAGLLQPTAALVTNIGKGHLGFFGTLEKVYAEKTALFDAVEEGGVIFLNIEDPYLQEYPAFRREVITVGFSKEADVFGKIESADHLGRFKFRLNDTVSIQLNIPGEHNVLNALLACAAGLHYGVSESTMREVLENFSPAAQRMEVFEKNGILFINDAYNANPQSMRAAVDYLAALSRSGKRILALGDMLELGDFAAAEHRELGEYIAGKSVDIVLLYGPESKRIQEGILRGGNRKMQTVWCEAHAEIVAFLQKNLSANDAILVKGSRGMKMEKVLEWLS